MSLSKIYRGAEAADVREFHFSSFGEDGAITSAAHAFVVDQPVKAKVPATSSAPSSAAAALTKKDVDEAYARGQQDAMKAAAARLESSAQALAATLKQVDQLRAQMAENSRDDMLRLVMAIAEQIIRREVSVHADIINQVIAEALTVSVRADHYRIKVNPADLAAVNEHKPLFLASISGLKNLMVEADPAVTAGGCQIESDLGTVDATLETQLAAIRQALQETMTGNS
ncbi:flagellar assembly protein FliH [Pelovirga terrestris]|uniref:Flagellar assembly protein FliH n=1 Tax=Pelovirga terrestris TaxID=2771352 RepID=A0A8J6UR26_9BACT|nr:flagellar assembly protein FliH [Pelovirga terrestris]MBD1400426.1 flagellar assembly protein FliH [Pelovirga terrestris]